MGTWVREFLLHAPIPVHVTVWDKDARAAGKPPIVPGYKLSVVIVNYEAFATPGRKTASGRRSKTTGRFRHRKLLMQWVESLAAPAALVLDESHKIKSASGKAASMLVGMGEQFEYRAILTGTPLTKAKRAYDIYMQWKFLNPSRFEDWSTSSDFREHFGRWIERNGFKQFVGPRNMNQLQQLIREDAVIVRREDCFDLPAREDIVVPVKLSTSQATYKQMAEDMVAVLENGDYAEASIPLVQTLRLAQITSGFVTNDQGEVVRVGFEKAEMLEDMMTDLIEKDQKIIVVARWRADLDLIADMGQSKDIPVWSIRGGVSRADTDKAIHDFKEYDGACLMVLQPSASSLGIDLSSASTMIWYSHTPSWVDFTQCCDRIALSRHSTTFYHLVAEKSVDEVMLNTLATDGDVGRAILANPEELVDGHKLDLDDYSRLRGMNRPKGMGLG